RRCAARLGQCLQHRQQTIRRTSGRSMTRKTRKTGGSGTTYIVVPVHLVDTVESATWEARTHLHVALRNSALKDIPGQAQDEGEYDDEEHHPNERRAFRDGHPGTEVSPAHIRHPKHQPSRPNHGTVGHEKHEGADV